MKILFFTRQIDNVVGGLERQINSIVEELANRGHELVVISLDKRDVKSFYKNNSKNIRWIGLDVGDVSAVASNRIRIKRQIKLLKLIRQERPDIAVSFMIGAFYFSRIPSFLAKVPLILSERNSPDMYRLTSAKKIQYIHFFAMIFARKITIQFENYKHKYPFWLRNKMVAIPNSTIKLEPISDSKNTHFNSVFAGRFSFQKQILRIINGFNEYRTAGGLGTLSIYGRGDQQKQMEEMILDFNLDKHVEIYPANPNIEDILQKADALCLFSIWEGFPNVLAEALSAGIPSIGFRNCDGVNELIIDGLNGFLIEDEGDEICIASGLAKIESAVKSKKINRTDVIHSMSKYSPKLIYDKWENLLSNIA